MRRVHRPCRAALRVPGALLGIALAAAPVCAQGNARTKLTVSGLSPAGPASPTPSDFQATFVAAGSLTYTVNACGRPTCRVYLRATTAQPTGTVLQYNTSLDATWRAVPTTGLLGELVGSFSSSSTAAAPVTVNFRYTLSWTATTAGNRSVPVQLTIEQ
jgi:hypothetical protein